LTIDIENDKPLAKPFNFFLLLSLALIASAFILTKPADLFAGFVRINFGISHLFTDYVAVGGFGATLVNASLVMLFELLVIRLSKANMTGPSMAALLMTAGFAFFGTSLFNLIPIVIGVYLYSQIENLPMRSLLIQAFMGSAIGPLINFITFGMGLSPAIGYPLGILSGVLIGAIIPPLSSAFLRFHQGYNLYNIGFTAGVIGLIAVSVFRLFGFEVNAVRIIDEQYHNALIIVVTAIFLSLIVYGLILTKGNLKEYPKLMANSGRLLSDFPVLFGHGISFFNMGVMGFISLILVLILKGPLNGPVVGAMLTVAGFGALGKHPKNTIPVLLGSTLACWLHKDLPTTDAIVPILFGTTIAPLAGRYGPLVGLLGGYLHIAVVGNVLPLHGGLNLYNNGFSGGFVAAFLVPIIEALRTLPERMKSNAQTRISKDE
jgi:hypothetical protein